MSKKIASISIILFFLPLILLQTSCGGGGSIDGGVGVDGGETPDLQAPSIPSGVVAVPHDGGITVSWNSTGQDVVYNVYIASATGITSTNYSSLPGGDKHSGVSSTYVINNLTNGTTYYIVATAENSAGESAESAEISTIPLPIPSTPIGLNSVLENGQIILSWDDVAFANSYNLYLAREPDLNKTNYTSITGGVKITDVSSPYVVTGLSNEEHYYIVITAQNALAESSESYEIVAVAGFNGGWVWQNPIPTGNTLQDVEFMDTHKGWIVGEGGTILHTNDGGVSWENQWQGSSLNFHDISAIDANNAWVVGNLSVFGSSGHVFNTTDGGASWTQYALPAGIKFLSGVHFISTSTGWIVGVSGIYKTTDAGQSWVLQSDESVMEIFFIDANNGWAIGWSGTVYKTTDGGSTWSSKTIGSALAGIHFIDSLNGLIVDYTASGGIYVTTNGGDSWGAMPITANYLRDISFGDGSAGWVVGDWGQIAHTNNGGSNWSLQSSGVNGVLHAVSAVDANNAWVVGRGGVVLHTSDGGTTWVSQSSDALPSSSGLSAIDFVDENNGWTVGRAIAHTPDGGVNWSLQMSGLSSSLQDIDFIDANTGWAVGNGSQIYKTTDGGTNWDSQNSSGATQLWGVSFADASSGWAVGPSGVIRATVDGGTNWVPQTSGTGAHLYDVHFENTTTGWIAGSDGIILHTTNSGTDWSGQISGTTADIRDIYVLDINTAWAVDLTGNIIGTTDGGTNWNVLTTIDIFPNRVFFVDSQHGWLAGYSGRDDIYATTDGGVTWQSQSSGFGDVDLRGLSFIDENTGWAAGGSGVGVIIKTVSGGNAP